MLVCWPCWLFVVVFQIPGMTTNTESCCFFNFCALNDCWCQTDINQTGSISTIHLKQILKAAYQFFCPSIDSSDIDNLADKVVRKCGTNAMRSTNHLRRRTTKIQFNGFSKILLSIPVISDLVIDRDGANDEFYSVNK